MFNLTSTGIYEFDKELVYHEGFVYALAIGQTHFFSSSKDRKVYQFDLHGSPEGVFEGHENSVNCVKILDERRIITGSWDGTAKIWDIETKQCI